MEPWISSYKQVKFVKDTGLSILCVPVNNDSVVWSSLDFISVHEIFENQISCATWRGDVIDSLWFEK